MESIKKLQDAAKECLSDLRGIESKISISEGNVVSLESKRDSIQKEVDDLSAKKAELISFIGIAETNLKKEHEAKMTDLAIKSDLLDADRAKVKTQIIQAEEAQKKAEESKIYYDKLYQEYELKLKELNEKKEKLNLILK